MQHPRSQRLVDATHDARVETALQVRSPLLGSYSGRSAVTRGSRALLNPLLLSLTSNPDYNPQDTILIAGCARSGTTWLAETLGTIPRSAILFESLHPEKVPEAAAAGFPIRDILRPGEGSAEQKAFMRRVLQGRVLNWWTCSVNPLHRAIRPNIWIVKEIRANYLLEWIAGTFAIRRMVFILRHPCATIASRMAQGWRQNDARITVKHQAVRRKFPHLERLCRNLKDPLELMAASWCLINYVPLSLRPRPFHVIAYESLATRGVTDLVPVFADWGLDVPSAIERSLGRASATTKSSAMQGTRHQQSIDRWKSTLTADQIHRVLRVVRDFGMDFYTEDPEPDYDRLKSTLSN